ncbi:unnamed protein product, partial [Didymodactylos carnosus]
KLAFSTGFGEPELENGPQINEESAYRYTSIFQVSYSLKQEYKYSNIWHRLSYIEK